MNGCFFMRLIVNIFLLFDDCFNGCVVYINMFMIGLDFWFGVRFSRFCILLVFWYWMVEFWLVEMVVEGRDWVCEVKVDGSMFGWGFEMILLNGVNDVWVRGFVVMWMFFVLIVIMIVVVGFFLLVGNNFCCLIVVYM